MRKHLLLIIVLCAANASFAQIKVNSVGNIVMGDEPLSNAKLHLYKSTTSPLTSTSFGLHAIIEDLSSSSSSNTQPMYGAYFKNKRVNTGYTGSSPTNHLYGIYLDNTYHAWGTSWGIYLKNTVTLPGLANSYGFQAINVDSAAVGSMYGIHLSNTKLTGGNMYGVYLNNTRVNNGSGANIYGVYSTNVGKAYDYVYGIYSAVSGGEDRWAGYFTGGKVVVNGELYAWDLTSSLVRITSDERLKSDIKPLSDEKEKLYLLQGKSYKKALQPINLKDDSLMVMEKEETIEFSEYGYLAQELKEVFPDLVSQDSTDYYAVNYIGLIPIIVEALKDQRSEIEKKQIQIDKQQTQIDEQREQIKQLVKLIDIKSINKEMFEENGIESIPLLLQNIPNPFNQATEIGYYIPENVNSANIYIYDINGFQQKNIAITERGSGATTLQASALQAGIYFYTLICDGKPVDTKQMILTK